MSKFRDLSPLECSYLAHDTPQHSVFVNQFVLSGQGCFDIPQWQAAIMKAADANPGIKLKLNGYWGRRYWDSEGAYPNLYHQHREWHAENEQGAFFNGKAINCRHDAGAEIYLLESRQPKIVFRTHHALCDGAGTLHWMHEVFRALRNEPLKGSNGRKNEMDIVKEFSVAKNKITSRQWSSINSKTVTLNAIKTSNTSEKPFPFSEGSHWQTFRYQGDYSKIMSRIIFLLGKLTWEQQPDSHLSFRIPSDLRRLLEDDEIHIGNLTGAFDFELLPEQNPDDIYKYLLNAKRKNNDLAVFPKNAPLANWLPDFAFKTPGRYFEKQYRKGFCNISTIISYLGKIDLTLLNCASFQTKNMFAIPLPLEGVSISLGMMLLNEQDLSVCISTPKSLATHEQLNDLVVKLVAGLDELGLQSRLVNDFAQLKTA